MKKLFFICALLAAGTLHAEEFFFSDVVFNLGYVYSPESSLGFNAGLYGLDFSLSFPNKAGDDYTSFSQMSLTYGVKIFDWLQIPVGGSIYADENIDEEFGFNVGIEFLVNPFSDTTKLSLRANTINFKYYFFGVGLAFGDFAPSYKPPPAPRPSPYPTLTPQELRKVELAYAGTVRDLERQGRRLYINNARERAAFIRRFQGRPDTASVNRAKNATLPYYSKRETSEQAIVSLARKEGDPFIRVRMLHDWVSDVFSYDYDLLLWMDTVSGRNAEFTLGTIIARERGVCFEYAILFCFLMNAAGVDTYLVSDCSEPGIGHAYNMVIINGTGYIVDTTWDSGNEYRNGRIRKFDRTVSKTYFMPGVSESYRLRRW
jgi:transglutaminase-like putative cysteine protease